MKDRSTPVAVIVTDVVAQERAHQRRLEDAAAVYVRPKLYDDHAPLPSDPNRGRHRPGDPVYVGGYYNKNGAWVAPHVRSAPGTGTGRSHHR